MKREFDEAHYARIYEAVRMRLAQMKLTQAQVGIGLGISKQAASQQLKKTKNLEWLARVCAVDVDVLAKGDTTLMLAQPLPAPGWLQSARNVVDSVNTAE